MAVRDLVAIGAGALLAAGGVLAAVEVDQAPPPSSSVGASVPASARTPSTSSSVAPGPVPSAVRHVLDEVGGAASLSLDARALAQHVPLGVSALLTDRQVVLMVAPDTAVVP